MSRVSGLMLLLLLVLSVLPAPGASGADAPVVPHAVAPAVLDPEFMGMVIRDPWYDFGTNPAYPNAPNRDFQDTMGATLAQAGVRWVRLDFHIVGGDALGEIAKNDYFVNEVAPRYGFKVLALLSFGLLQETDPHQLNSTQFIPSTYGGGVNQYMDTWLMRALMIADRYQDKIDAYEVLSEENRLPGSADAISPDIMARMLTKFYRYCKNIGPTDGPHGCANARIILGGLHPRGTSPPNNPNTITMTDADYLRAVYDVANPSSPFMSFKNSYGRGYPVDGIGYHPYPEEIRPSIADARINGRLPLIRQALQDLGDPYKQFWITEVGYNVGFDVDGPWGPQPPQTDSGQVLFMKDVYTTLAERQLSNGQPEVANIFWFKYEDFPPATGPNAQQWGIVRIPFTTGACPGGACYDLSGTPSLYRLSFWTYRELRGLPVYSTYVPIVKR
jgi:hypothetical protein